MKRRFTCGFVALALAAFHSAAAGATPMPGNPAKGASVFQARCSGCHAGRPGPAVGPHLKGVVGRKAAATSFPGYTAALKASGVVFTEPSLDAFLAAPSRQVRGTAMLMATPSAQDRADLIAYLKTQR